MFRRKWFADRADRWPGNRGCAIPRDVRGKCAPMTWRRRANDRRRPEFRPQARSDRRAPWPARARPGPRGPRRSRCVRRRRCETLHRPAAESRVHEDANNTFPSRGSTTMAVITASSRELARPSSVQCAPESSEPKMWPSAVPRKIRAGREGSDARARTSPPGGPSGFQA